VSSVERKSRLSVKPSSVGGELHLGMKLSAKWQQNIGYAAEAPISKHQIPNNIQILISNDRNGYVSEFGHLVIGNYLEFGIWILGFECLFWFRACLVRNLANTLLENSFLLC
jgi:hypothetical protein